MGHRDIWGKDSKKWKKQCPCFDAEKEYSSINDMSFTIQDKTIEEPKTAPPIQIFKVESYIDKMRKLFPWNKKSKVV